MTPDLSTRLKVVRRSLQAICDSPAQVNGDDIEMLLDAIEILNQILEQLEGANS